MRLTRIAAVPAALAVLAVASCKKDSTGPGSTLGAVTCGAADAAVCPPAGLALGFNGSAGTPSITPANASTNISVANSDYVVGGATNSATTGYWFLVVGGNLLAWGNIGVASGVYTADIPLFCGQQAVLYRFDNATGHSFWYANITLTGCSVPLFRAQLTWDTFTNDTLNSDMDLHLVRPSGVTNSNNDCYFANCQFFGLEWGATGPAGDPVLDVDNTVGYGPENITMVSGPEAGTYRVLVYNYSGFPGTHPTVKLYFNDHEQVRYTSAQPLDWPNNAWWNVATVDIANKIITAVNTYSAAAPAPPGRPAAVMPRKP